MIMVAKLVTMLFLEVMFGRIDRDDHGSVSQLSEDSFHKPDCITFIELSTVYLLYY